MSKSSTSSDASPDVDEWRKRCPKGHADWTRTGRHYFCHTCNREFDRLVALHRPISLASYHEV
ncbi:hypothetical protein [Haladaptatus sp. NG-SE-30]